MSFSVNNNRAWEQREFQNYHQLQRHTGMLQWKMSPPYSELYHRNLGWLLPTRWRLFIQSGDNETAGQLLLQVLSVLLCFLLGVPVHYSLWGQGNELHKFTDTQAHVAQTQLNWSVEVINCLCTVGTQQTTGT